MHAPALDPAAPPMAPPIALAVADVNWFTTEHLVRAIDPGRAATLALRCDDYRNAWRRGGRPWNWNPPTRRVGPRSWRRDLALPPGWMKRFPELGMRPIGAAIRGWRRRHAPDLPLRMVATYPFYAPLVRQVAPERWAYLNVDDYTLYWPDQAEEVRAAERRAVLRADLTVCTSASRVEELQDAVPEAAFRIRHLPHGAPPGSIADEPLARPAPAPIDIAHLPQPLLGYVGGLGDRVDWCLLDRLAAQLPDASIVLVGRLDADDLPARTACLARPNVHAIGWRPQATIHDYNRAFDVCLIPYDVGHPFNRACCPTKIMDTMGSGRPMVSTDLPECRLSAHLFEVAPDAERFVAAVAAIVGSGSDDGKGELRWNWARRNTCEAVAARLLDWLG